EQSRGFNDQKRAKPLAAAKGCVTHGFHQPRGPRDLPSKRLGVQQRVQELLDISSGLIEPRLKGYFLLRTHERNLAGRVLLPTLFLTQCIEYVRVLVPEGWPGGAIRRSGRICSLDLSALRARRVLALRRARRLGRCGAQCMAAAGGDRAGAGRGWPDRGQHRL